MCASGALALVDRRMWPVCVCIHVYVWVGGPVYIGREVISCEGLCLYTHVWVCFGGGGRGTCLHQPNNLIINVLTYCGDSMLSSVLSQSHMIHVCDTLQCVCLLYMNCTVQVYNTRMCMMIM